MMLTLDHIVKKYHHYTAVDDLSCTVAHGQVVGLLGSNGAGKSTTMNIIAGYFAPTAGRLLWNGVDVRSLGAAYASEVGYLPEIPPLHPELTVRESMEYTCGIRRIRRGKRDGHIRQLCELAGVADCLNVTNRSLSKGYRQRVGLALALIGNPGLIILDEPTAGLDPEQIVSIRELIRGPGQGSCGASLQPYSFRGGGCLFLLDYSTQGENGCCRFTESDRCCRATGGLPDPLARTGRRNCPKARRA